MELTQRRRSMYALSSRIFLQELDVETLKAIEELENFPQLFPTYSKWEERAKKELSTLIQEKLNVDFTDIAIMHLIPYESFYIREDGMIETGGSNPVLQFYNDYGFRVDYEKARVLSADHIGVELEFMYMLLGAEYKALEANDKEAILQVREIQKEFLYNHLLQFAPLYLINVAEQARTPFYKDSAKLVLEFLLEDYEYLKGLQDAKS
ncbi:MAG: molecular chaperone TorD family protein [Epsilonproteobacteria bacterium]|nr:molecular chaperone TorD family protein [Campylobacterota bacterium]